MASRTQQKMNATKALMMDPFAPTPEERKAEREARRQRHRERNEKMKEAMKYIKPNKIERVSEEELNSNPALRKLGWGNGNSKSNAVQYADPGDDYDMWQQAYRMLGGFIDCDHKKDQDGSHDDGDNNNDNGDDNSCSRWMMWASYIDPNYQGYGYDEYFGDTPVGSLDCHSPNTDWVLLGVYRQEFYQYIEQISKHLWAIDDYEYIVALAGLAYMTDEDCFYVGTTADGAAIYAGVAPKEYGKFEMALYTDDYCLVPNEETGYTFDDFGLYSDLNLGSGDGDDGNNNGDNEDAEQYWYDTQEYTLTNLNDVYETFKYCTSCIDYPTYQDGYYIGDTGTDDDDLINQCWKFYSHDSFPCEADCVALGHSQGTILSVVVGDQMYGQVMDGFYNDEESAAIRSNAVETAEESKFSRLLANAFVTFSFIVFVATFLAFAVARRSRYRESRNSKSRRLLDDDDRSPRSRRSTRSKSKGRDEGDGLFRSSSRKSRSKSKRKSRSKGRESERDEDYDPPRRSRSSKRSSSRSRQVDDF